MEECHQDPWEQVPFAEESNNQHRCLGHSLLVDTDGGNDDLPVVRCEAVVRD